jgi:hypothetical protein
MNAVQPIVASVDPAALDHLAADLGDARGRVEESFVAVGEALTQSAMSLTRISRAFEALPQDLASPELTEATTRLAAVGRRAAEISAAFAIEQTAIERLVAVVAAADHPISDLRRAVKMIGIVAINARVVAAGIIGDTDDFDVFTTDIAELSGSATKTIEQFSTVYQQLTIQVRRAAAQRAHFDASHRDTLSRLAERLEQSLASLVQRRQLSADGSAETGRVAREIAARVASAVMAMQVGDATRQRLEHVEAALTRLARLAGDAELGIDPNDIPAALASGLHLQTLQLRGTAQAFASELGEAERAVGALAADARTVLHRSRTLYGDGDAGQSSLSGFNAEIREAITVLRDCEAQRGKLEEVAIAVDRIVQVLLGHVEAVREIESSMRLVSLNAAIRCAQLGPRGRSLSVIATQLRELTGETVVAAEAAMTALGEAASLAQSVNAASSRDAAGQVAWLEQEAAQASELVGAVDRRLNDALGLLDQDGPTAIKALGDAADRLSGHEIMSEAIEDAAMRATELAGTARPRPTAAVKPLLAALRRSYTMDAERKVHDGFAGAVRAPASADGAAAALF